MKVAILTAYPENPAEPAGGVESVAATLIEALARYDDLDLHVITTSRSYRSLVLSAAGKVTIHRLPWAGGSTIMHAINSGRRQMQQYLLTLQPDLVHSLDTYGIMVSTLKMPRVFTIHGFIHMDTALQNRKLAWARARLWRAIELWSWAHQPHIIAISPFVHQKLEGIARGIVHDIDNPVHDDFFAISRRPEGKRILFVGQVSPAKNPFAVLRALACMGNSGLDVEMRLAGPCNLLPYYLQMQEFIRGNDLAGRVTFCGPCTRKQLLSELSAASVFVLPSLQENAPVSIGEAMAAGLPVITSDRCGMPFMVRHGQSGFLVQPDDIEGIARNLLDLFADDSRRLAMGSVGRQIAQTRFHPRCVAERTRAVYQQAAGC